jgi:hypothetical protein
MLEGTKCRVLQERIRKEESRAQLPPPGAWREESIPLFRCSMHGLVCHGRRTRDAEVIRLRNGKEGDDDDDDRAAIGAD